MMKYDPLQSLFFSPSPFTSFCINSLPKKTSIPNYIFYKWRTNHCSMYLPVAKQTKGIFHIWCWTVQSLIFSILTSYISSHCLMTDIKYVYLTNSEYSSGPWGKRKQLGNMLGNSWGTFTIRVQLPLPSWTFCHFYIWHMNLYLCNRPQFQSESWLVTS